MNNVLGPLSASKDAAINEVNFVGNRSICGMEIDLSSKNVDTNIAIVRIIIKHDLIRDVTGTQSVDHLLMCRKG